MVTSVRRVDFYDCDPAGILFFANIFKMAHSAYEEMLKNFKLDENYFSSDEFVIPIIKSEAEFIKTISFGDTLRILLHATQVKNSSFELTYEFRNMEQLTVARAKTVHVLVKKANFEKVELPEDLRKKLVSAA
jgi:YbgC/YbaW family acyl-CoA thioester hydrolase